MSDFSKVSTRIDGRQRGVRRAGGEQRGRPPDESPHIRACLPWIGPGTFLIAAYMHKWQRDGGEG
jgi:hypothetical protein